MHILHEQMYLLCNQVLNRNGYLNCWKRYLDMLSLICTILISKYLEIFNLVFISVAYFENLVSWSPLFEFFGG